MTKRKADEIDWENEPCSLCSKDNLPQEDNVQWVQCEDETCGLWYHCVCAKLVPESIVAYYCEACTSLGKGSTKLRDERPKRARSGIDYSALDAGEHVNSLRHSYTSLIESRQFAKPMLRSISGRDLTIDYLNEFGFTEPIVIHHAEGLDMVMPQDLTVDHVAELVGTEIPIEVMDVPTQGEDKGWTLGRWAAYYKDSSPTRIRNVISLEVTDSKLGASIVRPRIVRELDLLNRFWPKERFAIGDMPKVQTYCLMSLQNSYTDFHIDFAGTSVYYHILQGSKTFLFIPPTQTNLKKYSDWCLSSDQSKTFLADECKETFKVELVKGDTLMIPSGWIHAVHTPQKSLVIGGNFLHLPGMQKHLEVADVEDKTQVPGKFRFPQLERTLWFTALGILAHRTPLTAPERAGVYKMAIYLFEKASIVESTGHKAGADRIPYSHLAGSPCTVIKLLLDYVNSLAPDGPSVHAEHQLTTAEKSGPIMLVKVDLTQDEYERLSHTTIPAHIAKVAIEGKVYIEAWVILPTTAQGDVEIYLDLPENRGTYLQRTAAKLPVPITPHTELVAKAPTVVTKTQPPPYNIEYDDNNYIPPIMVFQARPISPHAPRRQAAPKKVISLDGSDTNRPFSPGPTTCFRCKTRKRKCDKARPCKTCSELGLEKSCIDSAAYIGNKFARPPGPAIEPLSDSFPLDPAVAAYDSQRPESFSPGQASSSNEIAHGAGVGDESLNSANEETSTPQTPKKSSPRCTRCAHDRKQCGREQPVCDRCQKRGFADSCIYPAQTSKSKKGVKQQSSTEHAPINSAKHNNSVAPPESGIQQSSLLHSNPQFGGLQASFANQFPGGMQVHKNLVDQSTTSHGEAHSERQFEDVLDPELATVAFLDRRSRELASLADQVTQNGSPQ